MVARSVAFLASNESLWPQRVNPRCGLCRFRLSYALSTFSASVCGIRLHAWLRQPLVRTENWWALNVTNVANRYYYEDFTNPYRPRTLRLSAQIRF